MSIVRLVQGSEMSDFIDILFQAYPMIFLPTDENRKEMTRYYNEVQQKNGYKKVYGLFRDGQMLGGMLMNDFTMNVLSKQIPAGGVGSVAVDFLHKKEKVAKEMISYFLTHYREQGYGLTVLYPFRPDFYKKMGFGYGTKMQRYRIKPRDLPVCQKEPSELCYLGKEDMALILECHNRLAAKTHGMIKEKEQMLEFLFLKPEIRAIGCLQQGRLLGYLIYRFEKSDEKRFLLYDMYIEEFMYENSEVLQALLAFLNSQQDQVQRIIIDLQDEFFHFLPYDPRDGSGGFIGTLAHVTNMQGLGIMYRIINLQSVFVSLREHDFNGQSCRVRFSISDNFLPNNNDKLIVHFTEGRAEVKQQACFDVELSMDIADFSALFMGTVTLYSLYKYGLARMSDEKYLAVLNRLFLVNEKPVCTVRF